MVQWAMVIVMTRRLARKPASLVAMTMSTATAKAT
jgi:hypothetical protein